jgi:hypothetical protein
MEAKKQLLRLFFFVEFFHLKYFDAERLAKLISAFSFFMFSKRNQKLFHPISADLFYPLLHHKKTLLGLLVIQMCEMFF